MPLSNEADGSSKSIDLGVASLAIAIITFFSLYQLIFVFVATAGLDGECLYTFWLPSDFWWQNPYWLVVVIVTALLAISLFCITEGVRSGGTTKAVFGIVAAIVLSFWLYGLSDLWKAMLFEKGEISSEAWYQSSEGKPLGVLVGGEYVCKPGI
jgi:hypothetical protein